MMSCRQMHAAKTWFHCRRGSRAGHVARGRLAAIGRARAGEMAARPRVSAVNQALKINSMAYEWPKAWRGTEVLLRQPSSSPCRSTPRLALLTISFRGGGAVVSGYRRSVRLNGHSVPPRSCRGGGRVESRQ